MYWYLKALRNYANFDGRARRKEYWFFYIFQLIALMALSLIASIIGGITGDPESAVVLAIVFSFVYMLVTLIPNLAVSVRRLHDTGHSGFWLLLGLIPMGNLVLLVFMCIDSSRGDNDYGPSPKYELG